MQAIMEKSYGKMQRRRKLGNKGFSLVELIIVIAIMAALIAILAPMLIRYVQSSRQSADLANFDHINTAFRAAAIDPNNRITAVTTLSWDTSSDTANVTVAPADPDIEQQVWDTLDTADGTVAARSAEVIANGGIITIVYDPAGNNGNGTFTISVGNVSAGNFRNGIESSYPGATFAGGVTPP